MKFYRIVYLKEVLVGSSLSKLSARLSKSWYYLASASRYGVCTLRTSLSKKASAWYPSYFRIILSIIRFLS